MNQDFFTITHPLSPLPRAHAGSFPDPNSAPEDHGLFSGSGSGGHGLPEDEEEDAEGVIASRIAEIHLLAMDSNPLLHAQFPTPESLAATREFLGKVYKGVIVNTSSVDTTTTITESDGHGHGGILVAWVRDTPGKIIAFATWEEYCHPVSSPPEKEEEETTNDDGNSSSSKKLETEISYQVAGCQREYLDGYARLAKQARDRYFGGEERGRECYQLSFVCTDPAYQGKGAGSALTRKVLELAAKGKKAGGKAPGLPVYLESTMLAVPMYEKLGFKAVGSFEMKIPCSSSSLSSMTLGSTATDTSIGMSAGLGGSDDSTATYREICMVWRPDGV